MRFFLPAVFVVALLSIDFNVVDAKLRGNAKKAMRKLGESDATGETAETMETADSDLTADSDDSGDTRRKLDASDDEAGETMETADSDLTADSDDSEK